MWVNMSTAKGLSGDGKWFYKFEGLGRYGAQARARSEALFVSGFGPELRRVDNGYTAYRRIDGDIPELSPDSIKLLAEYVAWRGKAFARTACDVTTIEQMARFNHQQLWQEELSHDFRLGVERPAVVDGRMMPYEWRSTRNGTLLKVDAASHGDSHFFPGATDIAWDVAGAIVEWEMDSHAAESFIDTYRRAAGDDVSRRLANYMVAYCAFQAGYAQMAASAMVGTDEEPRLRREVERYGTTIHRCADPTAA
jgi:hypothetical protein